MEIKNRKILAYWLFTCCAFVALMVAIGGITRLTESGLSIVEWQPLMGVLPPTNEDEWVDVFNKYMQSPEYQKKNFGMELEEFKDIFFWEYLHRLVGRLSGVVFFVPFMFFLATKKIKKTMAVRFAAIFALGGLQGLVGWFMVQSGLVDRPDVSQYRLALHLGMAFLLFALLLWTALGLYYQESKASLPSPYMPNPPVKIRRYAVVIAALIPIQVLLGALVAGLDAGLVYNTFPTMNGAIVPSGLWVMSPWYVNFFENVTMVQFIHRMFAMLLAALIIGFWFAVQRKNIHGTLSYSDYARIHCLLIALVLQMTLGVLTLVHHVPVILGSLHQMGALLLFSLSLWVVYGLTHRAESHVLKEHRLYKNGLYKVA